MTTKTPEFLKLWLISQFVYRRTVRTNNLVVMTDKGHSNILIKKKFESI